MGKVVSITDPPYGKLTVVKFVGVISGRRHWECLCACGNPRVVRESNLWSGNATSCGCSHIGKATGPRRPPVGGYHRLGLKKSHGHCLNGTKSVEYNAWVTMIRRCTDPKCPVYPRYGGRGITVCAAWTTSFENFVADMGMKPSPDLSIDRRDNSLGYFCGHCEECVSLGRAANCRWATKKEQSRNMRSNRLLTYRGETLPVCDWAERLGIRVGVIHHRINRGWSTEDALSRGVQSRVMQAPPVGPSMRLNLAVTA